MHHYIVVLTFFMLIGGCVKKNLQETSLTQKYLNSISLTCENETECSSNAAMLVTNTSNSQTNLSMHHCTTNYLGAGYYIKLKLLTL